ncbi:MAG: hypothetical protein J6I64_04275, partial [Lachnospiraceae bacterium]|nr:hypothetical protein [Lachnospiraceae bacterium]
MWYRILPQILNMSLTASIAILFVLLARQVLKRAPKIFSYALWGIVLFRLLCPVALTSDYSLMQLIQRVTVPTSSHTSSAEYIPSDLVESVVAPQWMTEYLTGTDDRELAQQLGIEYIIDSGVPSPGLSLDTAPDNATDIPTDPSQHIPLHTDPYPLATPITMATFLWLAGILSLLYCSLRSLRRLHLQLVGAVPLRDNIYLADHITTPFVLGV